MSKESSISPREQVAERLSEYRGVSPSVVVLLSGGLDSAVLAAACIAAGLEVVALTTAYGQRHHIEVKAACRVANALGIARQEITHLPLLERIRGSALIDSTAPLSPGVDQPNTYVPGRNLLLLANALALAESVGSRVVLAGSNADDAAGYPDCRAPFFEAVTAAARNGTRMGETGPVMVDAPLSSLTKAEVIRVGMAVGAPIHLTHSCYDPRGMVACGRCDACCLRRRAFRELNTRDPALTELTAAAGEERA